MAERSMAGRRPTVSVVVPCHNYGRFIAEALASLDEQDLAPDEILVCDDGSTDGSWDMIVGLVGDRPDVLAYRHEQAWGLIRTFNELVSRSSGEIIVGLSADDRLGPTYLRRMVEDLEARELDFGYSDFRCFGAENWTFTAPEMNPDRLVRFNFISGTAAFRRTLFDAVGGYHESFDAIGYEDWDFWISAVEHGMRGGRVPGCLLEWRRHASGSRNNVTVRQRVLIRAQLLRRHPRFFLHPRSFGWLTGKVAERRKAEVPA
jgi:glycosyltransferase involved in cell wall biosynthesis